MYAIIGSGGKQYKVQEGQVVRLEKLKAQEGTKVELGDVLLVKTEGRTYIGAPLVKGAKVEATVLKNGKGRKVVVFKFKRRKQYKRKRGHRQPFTEVRIDKILLE